MDQLSQSIDSIDRRIDTIENQECLIKNIYVARDIVSKLGDRIKLHCCRLSQ